MIKSLALAGALTILVAAPACTDLTEVPRSSITPDNFYRNETEAIGGLASVYAGLRNFNEGYYEAIEVSTDEIIVPTRGTDWYDNGKWLDIHHMTWTGNSPGTLGNINDAWNQLFNGVARANVVLDAMQNVSFTTKPGIIAELRVLRALYYYALQDLFGGVPIVCPEKANPVCSGIAIETRERNTRADVFKFIESELIAARPDLPPTWSAAMNGRMTQGAVDALLAGLYLNAQVFSGTVTAAGLQKGAARWQDAVTVSDRLLNSPNYALSTDWRSNFRADNGNSKENILVVKFLAQPGLGLHFVMESLHYNQYSGGETPWNGFSTLAETYNAFDAADQRRQIFLAGPQFNQVTGLPAKDRAGNPLIFDPNIPDDTKASESNGVRIVKWPVDPAHLDRENGNDYALFRLAEIYLIKAEALNELSPTNGPAAVALINTVRARVFSPPKPLATTLTQQQIRDAILQERLYELTDEGKRRQDLIRNGQYITRTWAFKSTSALTQPYRVLMAIPDIQLGTNPKLVQNAGY
ncbi:MAG TPA: RagB/SusD family nutrient uptake outer membrane protein [Gemmatimonadaceae bacterium]|nr:RagB/SusD family nutrient uptake outer membrane protein [Gemmatimonadaceae bacterium]